MLVFFFNDAATTEIYTLSLHDALPILEGGTVRGAVLRIDGVEREVRARITLAADGLRSRFARRLGVAAGDGGRDRKSTRLNSSHANISYAVFCLKKKKTNTPHTEIQPH